MRHLRRRPWYRPEARSVRIFSLSFFLSLLLIVCAFVVTR